MKRSYNLKSFSFSLILGPDGRWRNSLRKAWYLSRMEAWRSGMEMVRRRLDEIESGGANIAGGERLATRHA